MYRSFVILMLITAILVSTNQALRAQDGAPNAAGTPVYLPFVVDGNDASTQTDHTTDEQGNEQSEALDDDATPPLIVRIFFDSADALADLFEEFDVL